MFQTDFARKVQENNLTPVQRYRRKDVNLFIAEGLREPSDHPESMNVAHWTVLYAIGMDEKIDTANFIRIPAYVNVMGVPVQTTQETRLEIARDAAEQWTKSNMMAGRY